ncbi:YebC/PmpR family DNA-binding transcriptional regulator [Oribacterium sp. HCP28S3_H8]|uniref:YebC/PmpR family DNA-binding transcriptional regulator n=1 Tax=Oribacterium sp. HCP28S3_H8 TaxID=3438945 RepID=UPI0030246982|nr:YebC/PmpR family DNA-binding transcriptional regulator [Oribacterium sp.]
MSGHSKFSNIRAKKEKNDAAKGKIFTLIGHEIALAVREGGPDPSNNSKLAAVVAKAKANNMPNDTINNGIKKAAGSMDADNFEELQYEGYGPNGVAMIVKVLTDNKNRAAADVRSAFTKGKGSLATQGAVSFMFDEKGQIILDKEAMDDMGKDFDTLMDLAIEAGAEDIKDEEDSYEIITDPNDFADVRENLEKQGIPMAEADIVMIPQNYVSVTDEEAVKGLRRTLDLLDESQDVQSVYTNWAEENDEDVQ